MGALSLSLFKSFKTPDVKLYIVIYIEYIELSLIEFLLSSVEIFADKISQISLTENKKNLSNLFDYLLSR